MKLQRWNAVLHQQSGQYVMAMDPDDAGAWISAADVDALLARIRAAVEAEREAGAAADVTADGGPEDWAEADAICDYLELPRRKRIARQASVMAKAMDCTVRYTGSGVFDVASPSGNTYTVAIGVDEAAEHWTCGCEWSRHGGAGCAHVRAVEVWLDRWQASRAGGAA